MLPAATGDHTPGSGEPMVESMLWLLLTGEVPTIDQSLALKSELQRRSTLPPYVEVRSSPSCAARVTYPGYDPCQPILHFR